MMNNALAPEASPRLTIVGDISVDLVMGPLDHWPAVGTEMIMQRSELRAGGSGGNTALALRSLGVPCQLVAQAGNDAMGHWLVEQFIDMQASLSDVSGATSLSVGIIHRCGERTFLTTRGHLEHSDWAQLHTQINPQPPADSIVVLTGVFLLPRVRVRYRQIIAQLREYGYRIAIDTGWPAEGWSAALRAEMLQWLKDCDHVLLNEAEILALADCNELEPALKKLSAQLGNDTTLVAKIGARGAMAIRRGELCMQSAPCAEVFDTIGAGDAFNAGYLAACLRGDPASAALRAGCTAATAIISRFPRQAIRPGEICA
jgi:ribokinase